jgi:transposase
MARPHAAYPIEFRQKIIDLARAGRSAKELSAEFRVSRPTIANWLKQADLDTGRRNDGITTAERDELVRLRKDNKQLRLEREILSKATAWFARESETLPDGSSRS